MAKVVLVSAAARFTRIGATCWRIASWRIAGWTIWAPGCLAAAIALSLTVVLLTLE